MRVKRNKGEKDRNDTTLLDELREKFMNMTPAERNDRIQALYCALLEGQGKKGKVNELGVSLLKALARSFDISIKFEELDRESDDSDAF